jgi:hypothetical protein
VGWNCRRVIGCHNRLFGEVLDLSEKNTYSNHCRNLDTKSMNAKTTAVCKTTKNASEYLCTAIKLILNFPPFYVATPHHKRLPCYETFHKALWFLLLGVRWTRNNALTHKPCQCREYEALWTLSWTLVSFSVYVIKQGQERAPLYQGSSFIPASNYRGGGHPAVLSSSVIEERNNEASKQYRAVSTN